MRKIILASFLLLFFHAVILAVNANPDKCSIIVYRGPFIQPLTDWPEAGGKPRSPRYYFETNRPITVEVILSSSVGDTTTVKVLNVVTFEVQDMAMVFYTHDSRGYVYRTKSDNYLYLIGSGTGTTPTPSLTTSMVNEGVLDFTWVGDAHCEVNWMVDAAEFTRGGIDVFFTPAVQAAVNIPNWWLNGDLSFPGNTHTSELVTAFSGMVSSAGTVPESDFLYVTSHGETDGTLVDNSPVKHPGDIIADPLALRPWSRDVEWVLLDACSTLSNAQVGLGAWATMLTGPHGAHGILAAFKPVSGDLTTQLSQVLGLMQAGGNWVDSYSRVYTAAHEPWAVLYHPSCAGDNLETMAQDGEEPVTYRTSVSVTP
jgi:hypothetical protein